MEASQVSWAEKAELAVADRLAGTLGGVVSPPGPSRLVAKAASSRTTSQVPLVVLSPTWSTPMAAVPRLVLLKVRSGTATPSSQTSTTPVVMFRCSSSACQPGPGATALVVPPSSASLRNPSFPWGVMYRYAPLPVGVSRSRSRVTWEAWLLTSKATRAYASM